MSAPPKTVSNEVMDRISDALDALTKDTTLARTKREIERLTGFSHASVARAFVQDAAASPSRWRLNSRFSALVDETGQRSPDAARLAELAKESRTKGARITELEAALDAYAQALYVQHLKTKQEVGTVSNVTRLHLS